jgi:hypothetical protein
MRMSLGGSPGLVLLRHSMSHNSHSLHLFPFLVGLLSSLACTEASRTVEIHGKDYAFVAPTTLPSGNTTFRFINDGSVLHEVQLFPGRARAPKRPQRSWRPAPFLTAPMRVRAPFSSHLQVPPLGSTSSSPWGMARCMACCVNSGMPTPCRAIPQWGCGPFSESSESSGPAPTRVPAA